MWKFSGEIEYTCENCDKEDSINIDEFDIECIDSSERSMGVENIYELCSDFNCIQCKSLISLKFEATEYPLECLNYVIDRSEGVQVSGEPVIEYLEEIYDAEDLYSFASSIYDLIERLQDNPELIRNISPRKFEEVVSEIFKAKGFEVDLTQRTADGGKDIIAIHTDNLGIRSKYFIECKHYDKDNKVGVSLVRALQGVKNTKDGPNKTILVTTSTFTSPARNFVENEASSKWDITLADYDVLVNWLQDYPKNPKFNQSF